MKHILMLCICLIMFTITSLANVIDPPKLTPKAPTEEESTLTKEGKILHDKGKYDEAISKYEQVLKLNSDNVSALYEMGFSYFAKKDHKKSLEIALKGARYKSNILPDYYVLIGNNYDLLGEADKAIDVYQKGIKLSPQEVSLHYNLAVTYYGAKKADKAVKSLKTAISVNHNHLSSHFALSQVYYQTGYKIPALLASLRFLANEPKSNRSEVALKLVKEILQGSAKEASNQINILMSPEEKKDEGDFSSISAIVALTSASRFLEENKKKTDSENLADQVEVLFSVLKENVNKKNKGFGWEYYVPYFVELDSKNYSKAFIYYILQSTNSPEVKKWLSDNQPLVDEFLLWSKNYSWPKPKS